MDARHLPSMNQIRVSPPLIMVSVPIEPHFVAAAKASLPPLSHPNSFEYCLISTSSQRGSGRGWKRFQKPWTFSRSQRNCKKRVLNSSVPTKFLAAVASPNPCVKQHRSLVSWRAWTSPLKLAVILVLCRYLFFVSD